MTIIHLPAPAGLCPPSLRQCRRRRSTERLIRQRPKERIPFPSALLREAYHRAMYNPATNPTSAMMKQAERNVPRLNSASISSVIVRGSYHSNSKPTSFHHLGNTASNRTASPMSLPSPKARKATMVTCKVPTLQGRLIMTSRSHVVGSVPDNRQSSGKLKRPQSFRNGCGSTT